MNLDQCFHSAYILSIFADKLDAPSLKCQKKAEKGFMIPCNHAPSRPQGARALGERQTLTKAGSRAPRLLLSRIHATMLHLAPQGREPSGCDRHYPKPDLGLPDYYYHESQLALLLNRWGAWVP